jgi:hypothetical protein
MPTSPPGTASWQGRTWLAEARRDLLGCRSRPDRGGPAPSLISGVAGWRGCWALRNRQSERAFSSKSDALAAALIEEAAAANGRGREPKHAQPAPTPDRQGPARGRSSRNPVHWRKERVPP